MTILTPPADPPSWFLCADGGGTSVKVVAVSSDGAAVSGCGGPCNVKGVGPQKAIEAILLATLSAFAGAGVPVPASYTGVWLALAGLQNDADAEAFRPYACEAFSFSSHDPALRITNDGHLLASPCLKNPHVDSTVALVAGTGSVSFAFRKTAGHVELVGRSGGWGYLLGDEGSAYTVARLAVTRLLADDDLRTSSSFSNPSSPHPPLLPLFSSLLSHLDVPDAAALIDKTYSDHAPSTSSSFTTSETTRKLWLAEAARVVVDYGYERGDAVDEPSRAMALSILEEAMAPLVETVRRLVGTREVVQPERAVLSLGGGMWKAKGYERLLVDGLKAQGITFAEVKVVESAAEEGAYSLKAQAELVLP
ncbi:hypothetical protein JCM6882_008634 [Rhodosporidiobolus microsporus]